MSFCQQKNFKRDRGNEEVTITLGKESKKEEGGINKLANETNEMQTSNLYCILLNLINPNLTVVHSLYKENNALLRSREYCSLQ